MKIFLLEDDSYVADSIIHAIELRGHEVSWAETLEEGRQFLAPVTDEPFDLAILDFNIQLDKGTDLLPLIDFTVVGYSGLPRDMERAAPGLKVFSKGDPFALIDYIESLGDSS